MFMGFLLQLYQHSIQFKVKPFQDFTDGLLQCISAGKGSVWTCAALSGSVSMAEIVAFLSQGVDLFGFLPQDASEAGEE